MAFGERGCVRRFFRSHIDGSGATTHMRDKAGGWLDHSRCTDSHEDRAFVQCAEDAIQLERHFAEPTDVWANPTAAFAPGKLDWRIVGVGVTKWRSAAPIATALEEFAVHMDDALRPCLLVKIVHILGAEEQTILQLLFKLSQREVRRIGLRRCRDTPTHRVELPDQPWIATPRMRRRDLLDPVVPPEAIHPTERWNPALGAYSCPGQNEEAVSGGN